MLRLCEPLRNDTCHLPVSFELESVKIGFDQASAGLDAFGPAGWPETNRSARRLTFPQHHLSYSTFPASTSAPDCLPHHPFKPRRSSRSSSCSCLPDALRSGLRRHRLARHRRTDWAVLRSFPRALLLRLHGRSDDHHLVQEIEPEGCAEGQCESREKPAWNRYPRERRQSFFPLLEAHEILGKCRPRAVPADGIADVRELPSRTFGRTLRLLCRRS